MKPIVALLSIGLLIILLITSLNFESLVAGICTLQIKPLQHTYQVRCPGYPFFNHSPIKLLYHDTPTDSTLNLRLVDHYTPLFIVEVRSDNQPSLKLYLYFQLSPMIHFLNITYANQALTHDFASERYYASP